MRAKTPPGEVEAEAAPEREEHPSSKLRRMQPLKSGGPAAAPAEPLDRSMRSSGLGLAPKFAIMIGATVAITSLIMAIFIHRSVSGEVDNEINEAGVRTARILCGLDGEKIANANAADTLSPAASQVAAKAGKYAEVAQENVQGMVTATGVSLPEGNKKRLDDAYKTLDEAVKAFNAELQKRPASKGGGLFLGTVNTKEVPGLINVMFLTPDGKTSFGQMNASEEVRIKTDFVVESHGVKIQEGKYNGAPVRMYQGTLRNLGGEPVGLAQVYLSAQKIEDVKGQLFTVMLLPLFISVLLGIGIAVFAAARVTRPIQLLVADINAVSKGDLEHQTVAHSRDEIGVVAKAFDRMTQGLKAAHEMELERKAAEHEMSIAAEIQSNLLPKKIPKIPGYDISAYYRPSKEVGGDMYDFIGIDQENLGILCADVSGKGVPGSMIMTMARSLLRMEGERNRSTADTLVKTNRVLARDIRRGMFVTCMYMILNARERTLLISSAGHNPLVVVRKQTGQVELVNPNGIALGFDKGPIFERTVKEQRIQLYPGDRFCTYTDGVPEAMSPEDEEFGDERFYNLCRDLAGVDSNQFVNRIVTELDEHKGDREQHDDITLVTARLL